MTRPFKIGLIAYFFAMPFQLAVADTRAVNTNQFDWSSTPNWFALRNEYGARPDFREVCETSQPKAEFVAALKKEDFAAAYQTIANWLPGCPVSLSGHTLAQFALSKLAARAPSPEINAKLALHTRWQTGLLNAIRQSGDGKTPESAFETISVEEEYNFLASLQLKLQSQSLLTSPVPVDAMKSQSINNPEAKASVVYFSPYWHFKRLAINLHTNEPANLHCKTCASDQTYPPAANAALREILGKLSDVQRSQLGTSIRLSPSLTEQLNDLAANGRLTDIQVISPNAAASHSEARLFKIWDSNTTLYFNESILPELMINKQMTNVKPEDLLPNNTTYSLGHIAYHMAHPEPKPDIKKVEGNDITRAVQEFANNMLGIESRAIIQGWNDLTEAAMQDNALNNLTPQQFSSLLLNFRYRTVILQAMQKTEGRLEIGPRGAIPMSDANVTALTNVLKSASVVELH